METGLLVLKFHYPNYSCRRCKMLLWDCICIFQFAIIIIISYINAALRMLAYIAALSLNSFPPFLLRSFRGGSAQRCKQSMILSGLSLSPWFSPASSPLHLSLKLLRKDHRTPSRPPAPSGSVSASAHTVKTLKVPNTSGEARIKASRQRVWAAESRPGEFAPLLCTVCLKKGGLVFPVDTLYHANFLSQHI